MRYKIPVQIIELDPGNYHMIVDAVFPDGKIKKWVIDTGASKSVFDQNLEKYYSTGLNETEELYSAGISDSPLKTTFGHLGSFSFGDLRVENMKVALLDLTHINNLYLNATDIKICGLLGGDFLMKHKSEIDYKRKRIVFTG